MIWLASFPRSGNTFFRNILFEVYGIPSSEYHLNPNKKVKPDFASYPVVKTHILPENLPPALQSAKSVYLIRDGRDALVSLAHHRKNITVPGSNYYINLTGAVLGFGDKTNGNWMENVRAWTEKADLVIRYEDLIEDPICQVEKLRAIINLPDPAIDKLPTFQSLKLGTPKYGSGGMHISMTQKQERADKFFRRGIAGAYKDEMPLPLQLLFWLKYRKQMKANAYF